MNKLTGLLLTTFLTSAVFASAIHFEKNLTWKEIKAKAAKEGKMIFFDAYASWCSPCQYLEKSVYTDESVAAYYNDNYINVKFDMEEGEGIDLAEEFGITSYPTLLFFSPDGELVHKYIGSMEADEFIELGKTAVNPSSQYYTLKKKAMNLSLADADFHKWAAMASDLGDAGKEEIISRYLSSKSDLLANEYIAEVALFYTDKLSDEQLAFLYSQKERIAILLSWNIQKTNNVLYDILFRRAVKAYEAGDGNTDDFLRVIQQFDATKKIYAARDLDFRIALFIEQDNAKAARLLIEYLNDNENPSPIEDVAAWLLDFSSRFDTEGFAQLKDSLAAFSFREIDENKEYWLYIMQLLCEINLGNGEAAKALAEKAFHHPGLPEEYKEIFRESYGFTG